ncbi:MAG: hypothetical protein ACAI44_21740 [Candidatus Sericytochromatia bacterium]
MAHWQLVSRVLLALACLGLALPVQAMQIRELKYLREYVEDSSKILYPGTLPSHYQLSYFNINLNPADANISGLLRASYYEATYEQILQPRGYDLPYHLGNIQLRVSLNQNNINVVSSCQQPGQEIWSVLTRLGQELQFCARLKDYSVPVQQSGRSSQINLKAYEVALIGPAHFSLRGYRLVKSHFLEFVRNLNFGRP